MSLPSAAFATLARPRKRSCAHCVLVLPPIAQTHEQRRWAAFHEEVLHVPVPKKFPVPQNRLRRAIFNLVTRKAYAGRAVASALPPSPILLAPAFSCFVAPLFLVLHNQRLIAGSCSGLRRSCW